MSDFVVSARKYRPSTFKSVVGQEALTTTLRNAILQEKLSHAYLFCGPRGVGKTSCARIFAKTINCQNRTPEGEACNECESCVAANEQRSYNVLELDAASNNSVNDIRTLIEQVYIAPSLGKYRVYIIDEVHMLSTAAFNAFLKTLEEPPAHAIFILATTEKHKVLPTIISRCQVHDFNRITSEDIAKHLQYIAEEEGIEADPEALYIIGMSADGGMRDALSMFDQIAGFGNGKVTLEGVRQNLNLLDEAEYFSLLGYIVTGNHGKVLSLINELLRKGYEGDQVLQGFSNFLRNILLAQSPETLTLVEAPQRVRERMQKAAQYTPAHLLWDFLKTSTSLGAKYKGSSERRLALEVALLKMCEKSSKSSLRTPPEHPAETSVPKEDPLPEKENPHRQPTGYTTRTTAETAQQSSTPKPDPAKRTPTRNAQMQYGFSISTGMRTGERPQEDQIPKRRKPEEYRSEAFSEEQLEAAWMGFRNRLESIFVKQTMMNHRPTIDPDGKTLHLKLNSSTQEQQLAEYLDALVKHLANELHNDYIALEVDVDPTIIVQATPREKFGRYAEQNKWFGKFAEDLGLRPIH